MTYNKIIRLDHVLFIILCDAITAVLVKNFRFHVLLWHVGMRYMFVYVPGEVRYLMLMYYLGAVA